MDSNICRPLDEKLHRLADSTAIEDRLEVLYSLLEADINKKLLVSKRTLSENPDRLLILGQEEFSLLASYIKSKLEKSLQVVDPLDLPVDFKTEVTDEYGTLNSLWGMKIFVSPRSSCIDIVSAPVDSVLDLEVNFESWLGEECTPYGKKC